DGSLYALAANYDGQQVLYRGIPINGTIEATFATHSFAGFSLATSGTPPAPTVGYGRIESSTTVSGIAIFGYRQNGILVSEAAVPAAPALINGRIYAEVAGPINTGIAIANPNNASARISYTLTRTDGTDLKSGSFTIDPNKQTAAFLDQA